MPERFRGAFRWVARGANLRVVVAGLVALVLFGYVVDIASHGDLAGGLGEAIGRIGWITVLLAVPYFALRTLTWHLLLEQVGVTAPLRQTVAAFSAGELTKSLPGGIYLETYVLARLERLAEREIVGAAVATTGVDVMVGTVSFLTAMAIGLPGRDWFRWLLVAVAGAWIVLFAMIWVMLRWWQPRERPSAARWVRAVGRIGAEAFEAAARLVRPQAVRPLAATAGSLAVYAVVLSLVLDSVGLRDIGPGAAIGVVTITSLANDLLPIPTELGLTEITGVGVLGAYGVAAPEAAIVMLGYRVLTTGPLTLVIGATLLWLRLTSKRPFAARPRGFGL
jgi:uncharacterized membrane protein YbhN (UPF0104 family)